MEAYSKNVRQHKTGSTLKCLFPTFKKKKKKRYRLGAFNAQAVINITERPRISTKTVQLQFSYYFITEEKKISKLSASNYYQSIDYNSLKNPHHIILQQLSYKKGQKQDSFL